MTELYGIRAGTEGVPLGTRGTEQPLTAAEEQDMRIQHLFKGSVGKVNCLKRDEKTPDPPGLKPGTLLAMSNALTI